MKRIAFIDLGSNSVRFVVIENNDDGSHQMIYQEKESIRLSQGMWEHQKLTQAAMDRAIKALQGFAHMAEVMEVDSVYAVATAAVRLAHNQKEFINRVEKETGFVLHCISGQEEARLGFLGIINTLSLLDFVSFDLGGASTEVSLVRNRQLVQSVSLPVGAVTLNGRFPTDEVVDSKALSRMMAYVETIIEDYPWLKDVRLPLVGIGGT
ncbi:MAG: exopolyphosphatase, partial [Veillonella sp.]|nr:exopolyphosphatase [Veillonella sp.]